MNFPCATSATRRLALPLLLAAGLAGLGGCSSLGSLFGSDAEKTDYRNPKAKSQPLEVPPDLSQLSRNSRFQVTGGVVSAAEQSSAAARPTAGAPAAAAQTVAVTQWGAMRIERDGNQRWLVVPGATPEQLWPQVRAFWGERGFTFATENAAAGVLETNWAENRSKIPQDVLRRTLGRLIDGLYDSGERDRYSTRIERAAGPSGGSEIYISHRGMQELYATDQKDATVWRPRPSDPNLEATMLAQLMTKLGGGSEAEARSAVAAAPAAPARARTVAGGGAALEVDEPFDRAWRRVGLALDRSGFTVEDRDRAAGLYFVRYVDVEGKKEEPGLLRRVFGSESAAAPVRYRIALKGSGDKTQVSVLSATGQPESSAPAQRIVSRLVDDLK